MGRRGGRRKGHTWWLNKEVKEVVSRKKNIEETMCRNSTEENKRRNNSIKNKAKKAASKEMRDKSEEVLTEQKNCPNGMLMLVKGLKTDSK